MLKKILIANRGEIAVRVMHSCRTMGIRTVAVYSDADVDAVHRWSADESVHIGAALPAESYLNQEKIIKAAKATGAEAIHPGYGFLSENAEFAQACKEAGIEFIGPSAESMRLMGDKLSARKAAVEGGAPVVPGLEGAATDVKVFAEKAEEVGYPVLLKASAGGGGKGMRLVREEGELEEALSAAAREAQNAFGDDRVYLEKYLERPRHIEVQVFGDKHGNVAHLFERECSIQRRHQKIIEETPAVVLSDEKRAEICEAAVKVAKQAEYHSAGTVEFLYTADGEFYFLEMNTRLQVEHPITELVTGLDLVAEQIRIAAGDELSAEICNATQRGHAIECRVYAEDAENNFFPSSGTLLKYVEPSGPGLRIDSGVSQGSVVGIDYDPILAKVITYGQTREAARLRMIDALKRYTILGVKTSNRYLVDILERPEFVKGETHTAFIDEVMPEVAPPSEEETLAVVAASALALEMRLSRPRASGDMSSEMASPWITLGDWRPGL